MSFVPSPYQKRIFQFVLKEKGHGIINAVAGSGKTTTLIEAARLLTHKGIFCAFNKHIKEELDRKFADEGIRSLKAYTIHSLGLRCLGHHFRNTVIEEYKYHDLLHEEKLVTRMAHRLKDILERKYREQLRALSRHTSDPQPEDLPEPVPGLEELIPEVTDTTVHLVNLIRSTLTPLNREAVADLINHYNLGIDTAEEEEVTIYFAAAAALIRRGKVLAEQRGIIDFGDMLYLPHVYGLQPSWRYDWIFVDECQDLSAAQVELLLKYLKPEGRMLCVGDPFQSIYGFAGADAASYKLVKERLKASEFPLSVSYRCPKKVVELARKICGKMEPRPGASEGAITRLEHAKLHDTVQTGDMVLSRTTAPLILLCIELLTRRKAAKVRGRDIGQTLIGMVQELSGQEGYSYDHFIPFLEQYKSSRLRKLEGSIRNRKKIEQLSDQVAGVQACYEGFGHCRDEKELCREIALLFSDGVAPVLLSTIHRAKGLERDRVFILDYDGLPYAHPDQKAWEREQERNCHYVAITRTRKQLFQVASLRPQLADAMRVEPQRHKDTKKH